MHLQDDVMPSEALDLALAAELQSALLPRQCPTVCDQHTAAARNRMCGRVGGDFYDLLGIDDQHAAVAIGDVIGHGVRAALLMSKILGMLRSDLAKGRDDPREVILAVNRSLIDISERAGAALPVSMVYGVIEPSSGRGRFVNAGHPEPLIYRPGEDRWLSLGEHGLVLGVEEYEPDLSEHTFQSGDRLALLTDGLLESRNSDGEFFGLQRVRELLARTAGQDPEQAADALFEAVDEHRGSAEQMDDETLLVIDRR